jgi:hypothetical protein
VSRPNVVRFGGLAAGLGGALYVTINALGVLFMRALASDWATRGLLNFLLDLLGIFAAFCFVAGLAGLYALLGERSGLGVSGMILAGLSAVLSASYVAFAVVHVLYTALLSPDSTAPPPSLVFPEIAVDTAEDLLLAGGALLLGVATLRARVLGRWSLLPLVLGALILPLLAAPAILGWAVPWVLFWLLLTLQGLCWMLLGTLLWASRRDAAGARSVPA